MKTNVLFIPPTCFFFFIIVSILFYFFVPEANIMGSSFDATGLILMGFGIYLIIYSWLLFRKHGTTVKFEKSTSIVEESLYKYSRNPMYFGNIIFLAGLSFWLGNVISFIFPIKFFILMNQLFIPFEEKNMEKTFGKKYLEYKNKVRRWV